MNIKKNKNDFFFDDLFLYNLYKQYKNIKYDLNKIKNRKNISKIRPGISPNLKKSSIYRDDNLSLLNQFINLNLKKGKKFNTLKSFNIVSENINISLSEELPDFKSYKNYSFLVNFYNSEFKNCNLNELLSFLISDLESIFEIKISKINKKKVKTNKKYSYEIVYIPKKRRLKHSLRALTTYKEYFKNYNFWERIYWSLMISMLNKDKSFLKKRRDFIYLKSIKFFKKKPKTKKIN